MAEAGLPLLAHTGGEHTLPVIAPQFSDPRILRLPLECGVKVIAAHCATKSGLTDAEYFHVFLDMLKEHPNLYGDTSAFNVPLRGRHARKAVQPQVALRLVHGSDFPVPVYGHWALLWRTISWAAYRRIQAIPNVLERDYQLKRAMGFGDDHFTRIRSLLRPRDLGAEPTTRRWRRPRYARLDCASGARPSRRAAPFLHRSRSRAPAA
jgi:hypothetical protein